MGIDDSYELRRLEMFSSHIGLTMGVDHLHSELLDVYRPAEALENYLRQETITAIGEAPEFGVSNHLVGRSSSAAATLFWVAGSLYIFITQAKDFDEGIATIKKWGQKLNAWRKHFTEKGQDPQLTVEALKVLCAADLHERFGTETEPCPGLVRTNAACAREPDGTWTAFGPVYVFIPDRRKKVTHLYAISASGEIQFRSEIPGFELQDPALGYLELDGRPAQLQVPDRTVDPAVESWNEMKAADEATQAPDNGSDSVRKNR